MCKRRGGRKGNGYLYPAAAAAGDVVGCGKVRSKLAVREETSATAGRG